MSSLKKANVALAAALSFLLLCTCAATLAFVRLNTSESWVRHTRDVQTAIAQLSITVSRAGRLRSEYVDSGDPALLQRQAEVVRDIRSTLATLQHLTGDNPQQQDKCRQLSALSEVRIGLMDDSIKLKQTGKSTLETQAPITRKVIAIASETDAITQAMYDGEERLLTEREDRVQRTFGLIVAILIGSLFFALLLFLFHHQLLVDQVKARTKAEMAQRAINARLLTVQDEERRKFARELHDSVGQYLAATKMGISMLQAKLPNDPTLRDCIKLLDDSIAETRTISHLLHPPLLDEAGLNSASSWYVEGFGKRSGIETKLDIRGVAGRLPETVELVLFRVLQESLTNVHRHSGATRADVSLNTYGDKVVLRVKDYGKGMPAHIVQSLRESGAGGGVGLSGMTERIHEIGGHLEIVSTVFGTEVVASVPAKIRSSPRDLSPPAVQEVTDELAR